MRRKTLLTAMLCMVLAVASQSISSDCRRIRYVKAESAVETVSSTETDGSSGKASKSTSKSETQPDTPGQTDAPATQSDAPATQPDTPAQTDAPVKQSDTPAQTDAPPAQPDTPAQTDAPPAQPDTPAQTDAPPAQPDTPAQTDAPATQPDTPAQTDAPAAQPDTPAQTDAPPAQPDTPAQTDAPVKQPDTPAQTDAPPAQPDTPAQTDAPATQPDTPAQTDAPATQPDTPAQTDAPAAQPDTPGQPDTPAEQPDTPGQPDTPATQPDTPGQTDTPVTQPDTPGQTDAPETQPDTPGQTDAPQTETSAETVPTETPSTGNSSTETPPAEPSTDEPLTEEPSTETEFGTEASILSETESEDETESKAKRISNKELIARQKIVVPPEIEKEFRFTKVEKRYALVRKPQGAQVYEKKSLDARAVGSLNYYGCCYILEDQKDDWYYIESGNVRGFVRAEDVVTDDVADRIVKIKGAENLPPARLLVARTDNAAFTYTHTTVQEVMASPEYALAAGEVNIYEQKKGSARVIGTMSEKDLCYILDKTDDTWVFVESGDARGFVEKASLRMGQEAAAAVADIGEDKMSFAEVLVKPEDNKACYYTLTSVKEASQGAKTREAMVNFAKQFIGNPYVWGGTSLTQGADCSGFVQSVYSYFGYSLPRVAEDQSRYGMQIPIESAEPGDLIFYARNGYVYHVSMYIGDDQVIHAAGRRVGIIVSGIGGNAVWATRVIKD